MTDNKKIVYLMQPLSMELQLKVYKTLDIESKRAEDYEKEEM